MRTASHLTYTICSHGPYSYGLCRYDLCSYGLYSYNLYSYGLHSYGLYTECASTTMRVCERARAASSLHPLYTVMAYTVMAYVVMAYIVTAYIVMADTVMASQAHVRPRPCLAFLLHDIKDAGRRHREL